MESTPTRASSEPMVTKVHTVLTLVPWRMRGRLILMTLAAAFSAGLDMLGVLAMLPLMQLLTSPTTLPQVVATYVVQLVGTDDRQRLLLAMALFVGFMFILKNAVMVGLRWWSIGALTRASAAAQATMLDRYVRASYLSHRQRRKPDIIQTVTGAVDISFTGVLLSAIALTSDALTTVVLLATLTTLSPVTSLIGAAVFGGTALLMVRVVKPHALRLGLRGLELNTRMWAYLNPAIEGFRESRIFGREAFFVDEFAKNRLGTVVPKRAQTVLGELPRYVMEIAMIFAVLVIAVALFAIMPESRAFGLLAVFAAAGTRVAPALNRVVANVNVIRTSVPSLDMVVDQLQELEATQDHLGITSTISGKPPTGDIVAHNVGFRYPDSRTNVLTGIDVTIPEGHTVALVGSSGAGKTTFADLLLGLFPPTEGSITVGGVDIVRNAHAWRRTVAAVSQRVYLWDATIRDLITYGRVPDEVDHELLDTVIRQARLADIIANMPNGLDTFVGEGGTRISGGQAQRIGIARALYSQPEVLILDEATSALDNETEHEITATLEALHGQLTVIVIAHRLSTVRHADEILLFSSGRLADRGTMTSLRERNPEFARLVELGTLV